MYKNGKVDSVWGSTLEVCAEAKLAAGFQNLLAVVTLMARRQVEWESRVCIAFFWFFCSTNYSGELRNSGFQARGDGRFQKKEEKGKKTGDLFLFCAPLPLVAEIKIGGSGGGGQKRRKICDGGGGVIFRRCRPLLDAAKKTHYIFFIQNSLTNNFDFKLSLIRCVFLAASSPKLNLLSHFCTLLFCKNGNLSKPLASLQGGGDKVICARGLFCTKFNIELLLFKAFFDAMRIFGSVELQAESIFLFLYMIIFQR